MNERAIYSDKLAIMIFIVCAATLLAVVLALQLLSTPTIAASPCMSWDVNGGEFPTPSDDWYNKVCPNLSVYNEMERMHYKDSCACYEYRHQNWWENLW